VYAKIVVAAVRRMAGVDQMRDPDAARFGKIHHHPMRVSFPY